MNWPQGFHRSKLEEHLLVRQVVGEFTGDDGAGIDQPDYEVDKHEKNKLSLIYDADTSQHSALIDALEEKNLVINGPPGTGKSQTITNLIAEALVSGKKVLFVSEKLAALQVVKSRLEKAKLGDFCLELHSHKTQKRRVVDDLRARHTGQYPRPIGIDGNLELLEQQKRELQAYAELMNTTLGNELGLTVFQVLWRAERHRQQSREAAPFLDGIVVPEAPHCGPARLGLMTSEVISFANHSDAIGQYGVNHPWFGLSPIQLRPGDDLEIQTSLKALIAAADGVDQARASLAAKGGETNLPVERAAQIALASTLRELPEPPRILLPDFLPRCFGPDGTSGAESAAVVSAFKGKVSEAKRLISVIEGKLIPGTLVSAELLERAAAWRDRLSHHGAENLPLTTLASYKEEIVGLLTGISRSLEFFSGLNGLFGRAPEQTDAGLAKALAVLQVCNEAPKDLLEYRQPSLGRPSTKELVAKAQAEYGCLTQVHTDLSNRFYLDFRPDAQALVAAIQTFREGDAWYRLLQGNWRRARKLYKKLAKENIRRRSPEYLQHLTTLNKYLLDHDRYQTNAEFQEAFGPLFKGDETDFDKIGRLIGWYERAVSVFAEASLAPGDFDISTVEDYRIGQLSEQYALAQMHAKALNNALSRLVLLTTGSHVAAEIQSTASAWPHRMEAARTFALELGDAAHFLKDIGLEVLSSREIVQALAGQLALRSLLDEIAGDATARDLLGAHFAHLDTNFEVLEQTLVWGQLIATSTSPPSIKRLLLSEKAVEAYPEIVRTGSALGEAWEPVTKEANQMQRIAPFDWNRWNSAFVENPGDETTDAIRTRAQIALDNLDGLLSWSQYLNVRRTLVELRLEAFVLKLEEGIVPAPLLGEGFLYRFYASIAKSLFQTNTTLSRFSGMSHNQIRESFVRLDRAVLETRGQECAFRICAAANPPPGNQSIRIDDRTEMALLKHLIGLQKPRTPIRQVMKRAGRAIQALKPCFMMGPLAVAQYLEPGAVEFDLVIMDEASQLRPEEAIGAVARGKQLVVVGDQNQLPPTSFFDRMMNVADDDDAARANASATSDSNSILDLCVPAFPRRTLKWHYRSQHESLIAFSNQRFYEGQMFVFPSPYPKTKHLGLRYHYIANGVYQNRQNIPEAKCVVDAVIEHMLTRSDESLGVVTLNITQRDLIEELLEQRLRSFTPGDEYRARWEEKGWPLFVKNLENVQGDERDVIFISTTFGKPPGTNVVHHTFGPITKEHGWRRLNVLFTRARKSLHLYSSMQPEDIVVGPQTPRGTAELRGYLDYAARGILTAVSIGEREPDSDFEVAVITVLKAKGYEVQPQLGVAKFFIDIAVRNPDRPGEFMAAIECDGRTYHSGVSVRDRDRIRQEILEGLGWKNRIWRIWSTDWFRSPQREIDKLVRFLEQRRAASAQEPPPYIEEQESTEEQALQATPWASALAVPAEAEAALPAIEGVGEDEELYVEVGDKVVYLDLEAPEEKNTFRIVAEGHIPAAGLINEAKPLAQAFLGAAEGEAVTLEVENRRPRHFKLLKIERVAESVSP